MKQSILFLLVLFSLQCAAQHENDKWYFGTSAGVDFTSGNPVVIPGGQTNVAEGTSVVCDGATGTLLFYTDGIKVWNANHQQMPNGFGLNGHTSATQSALIVRKPGTSSYYIFTAGSAVGYFGSYQGLCVSTVDMTLNSGLGDVTVKNQVLLTHATEKLAGVRNSNCDGFWVVAHGWNTDAFYSYPVTGLGIGTPVISNTGSVHQDAGSGNNSESIGYMRISNSGTQLALNTFIYMNTIELFDFDRQTGIVSNGAVIDTYPVSYNTGPYGLCFSPNDTRLYVSINSIATSNELYQYDLTLATTAAIGASQSLISSTSVSGLRYSALQLAPNGKIYMSKFTSTTLDVINNPNALGSLCGFSANNITITGGTPSYGLPNFVEMAECNNNNPKGIETNEANAAAIRLFPNPATGNITLTVPGFFQDGNTELQVYDVFGKVVYTRQIDAVVSEINTGLWSAGTYFFVIMDKGQRVAARKIVVQQ
jgi:hypothetical protein